MNRYPVRLFKTGKNIFCYQLKFLKQNLMQKKNRLTPVKLYHILERGIREREI